MTPEDREALKWALTAIRDDRDNPRDDYSKAAVQVWLQEERWEKAIAVVQRLLDNDFLSLGKADCLALGWARMALEDVPEIRWREPEKADAARDIINRLLAVGAVSVSNKARAVKEPTIVAVFAEGHFEEIFKCASPEEAQSFASGVVTGASYYGSGSCTAYVLPQEEVDMVEHEEANEIAAALGRIEFLGGVFKVQRKCDSAADPSSTGTCTRCGFATEDH